MPCETIAIVKLMLHLCETFYLLSWHTSTAVERLSSSSTGLPGEHLAPPTIWTLPHTNASEERTTKSSGGEGADSTEERFFMVDLSWTCAAIFEKKGRNMHKLSDALTNTYNYCAVWRSWRYFCNSESVNGTFKWILFKFCNCHIKTWVQYLCIFKFVHFMLFN